jgi:nucleotide-binding universal stress UspA family protein
MYKRILCPFDGSPASERGLREAIRLARDQQATLRVLHIVEEYLAIQSAGFAGGGLYAGDLLDRMIEDGKQVADRARGLAAEEGVQVEALSVQSPVVRSSETIVEQAQDWGADLIVMATHGRRGLSRLMLGSDAEGVVRSSPVPVLLVRVKDGDLPAASA